MVLDIDGWAAYAGSIVLGSGWVQWSLYGQQEAFGGPWSLVFFWLIYRCLGSFVVDFFLSYSVVVKVTIEWDKMK